MWNTATKEAWWKLYRIICFHMKSGYEGQTTPDPSRDGSPSVVCPQSIDLLNGKR